jgi:hypothetical protein
MEGTVNEFSDSEDSNFDSDDKSVVNHAAVAEMVNDDSEHEDNIDQSGNTDVGRHTKLCGAKKSVLQYLRITIHNQKSVHEFMGIVVSIQIQGGRMDPYYGTCI